MRRSSSKFSKSTKTNSNTAPVAVRVYAGGGRTSGGAPGRSFNRANFRPPTGEDAQIHERCVIRTSLLALGEGRPAVVRVVQGRTQAEVDRCWSTPQAPEGHASGSARFYRAEIMIYAFQLQGGGLEIGIKGGEEIDLLTSFAPLLQGEFVIDTNSPVTWQEDIHFFRQDGNRVHWLTTRARGVELRELYEFLEEAAGEIHRKNPQAHRGEARPPNETKLTEGFELRTGGAGLLARFHFVAEGEDVTSFRLGERTAQVLVISSGKGRSASRWIRIQPGVRGAKALLTIFRARDPAWKMSVEEDGSVLLQGKVGDSRHSVWELKKLLELKNFPLHLGGGFARR